MMIKIDEYEVLNGMAFSVTCGIDLDADDQDEQRDQLYAQMMGWA